MIRPLCSFFGVMELIFKTSYADYEKFVLIGTVLSNVDYIIRRCLCFFNILDLCFKVYKIVLLRPLQTFTLFRV